MASEHLIDLATIPHPGETVADYLDSYGWSQRDLARRTDLTPKTISEICNGKAPITPVTALAFEKALQRPAHFWLNLQRLFDEAVARRWERSRLTSWMTWAREFPLKEMRRRNFSLPAGRSDVDVLLNFFGVSSPDSWSSVWAAAGVAYRQTRKTSPKEQAVAAWVREVELTAREFPLAQFNEQLLRSALEELRHLTRRRIDEIMDPVQETCAAAGVAVVWVEELPGTGISGCARWLSDTKAVIGLTLRYKTDDQMWFTLFHELGHILLHRKRCSFVVDNAVDDMFDRVIDPEMQHFEMEANQFAADTLIPARALARFLAAESFTNDSIHDFAEKEGIGPGIVVGRLQHEGVLKPHQGNALKQKIGSRPVEG